MGGSFHQTLSGFPQPGTACVPVSQLAGEMDNEQECLTGCHLLPTPGSLLPLILIRLGTQTAIWQCQWWSLLPRAGVLLLNVNTWNSEIFSTTGLTFIKHLADCLNIVQCLHLQFDKIYYCLQLSSVKQVIMKELEIVLVTCNRLCCGPHQAPYVCDCPGAIPGRDNVLDPQSVVFHHQVLSSVIPPVSFCQQNETDLCEGEGDGFT